MPALTCNPREKIWPKIPVIERFFHFLAAVPFAEGHIRSNYRRLNRILSPKPMSLHFKKFFIRGLLFDIVVVKNHKVVINIRSWNHLQQKDFVPDK